MERLSVIRTPDQRLLVFASSALSELSGEREAGIGLHAAYTRASPGLNLHWMWWRPEQA
jgi:hypothetical protein